MGSKLKLFKKDRSVHKNTFRL